MTDTLPLQEAAESGLSSHALFGSFESSPRVAERWNGKWGCAGWRLHDVRDTTAILTSQSAGCDGAIMRKEVCVLNIRILGKNGNLEKWNPYAI